MLHDEDLSMPNSPTTTEQSKGASRASCAARPGVRGKFIFVGEQKFYLRGVTYGPFRPDENGNEYGEPQRAEKDFALMRENGINSVRTYTVPPRWFLDAAWK